MNLIENIFYEYFNKFYYFQNDGRAYCEYIIEEGQQYQGKICFFHFSFNKKRKLNSFFAAKIFFFIKCFYSNAFLELYPIIKYCINNNIVISINSLSEYKFVIKFWNENYVLRKLLEKIIFKYTKKNINIEKFKNSNFFELEINLKNNSFCIEKVKIYTEVKLKDLKNIKYKKGYLDKDNIFMVLDIYEYNFLNNKINNGILFKLKNPIKFSNSNYLLKKIYDKSLKGFFESDKIFLGFIEQMNNQDLLYFTKGYSIRA